MGYYKNDEYMNLPYNKEVREANETIGELMEKNKHDINELNKIKQNPLFKNTTEPVQRQMEIYITNIA